MASTVSTTPAFVLPPSVHVSQPPHLEGDPTLATEVLPGPPTLDFIRLSTQKRDPRKPSLVYSYLPETDPGTSYSGIMHGTLVGQELVRPTADNRSATGRAQRASARHQNEATASATVSSTTDERVNSVPADQAMLVDSDPDVVMVDHPSTFSRSTSSPTAFDPVATTANGRPKRRDKGKAKEVDVIVRVKDEPSLVSLQTPEPSTSKVNQDHCSACQSTGTLVYCDSQDCPRAYHLWCLDPPIESIDEGDSKWFCPECVITGKAKSTSPLPEPRPPHGPFHNLYQTLTRTLPTEYQLPPEIRTFFKDVSTGDRGTYVDSSELRPPRINRHGQLEERDPHRLKDKNGEPVLCFRCGKSSLSDDAPATIPSASKRPRRSIARVTSYAPTREIISCDYCPLHWHLDCLDPPLPSMPSFLKKWMCPNHAEQIVKPKRRIPKQNAPPIEITKPGQFNNGNIDIIQPEPSTLTANSSKMNVDEVYINGRRYRVPERVILLDFWDRISNGKTGAAAPPPDSRSSSPLTALSSSDETPALSRHAPEELAVAQMLCGLRGGSKQVATSQVAALPMSVDPKPLDLPPIATMPLPSIVALSQAPLVQAPTPKLSISLPAFNPQARTIAATPAKAASTTKKKAANNKREKASSGAGSRTRASFKRGESSGTSETPPAALSAQSSRPSRRSMKAEEVEANMSISSAGTSATVPPATVTPTSISRPTRVIRRNKAAEQELSILEPVVAEDADKPEKRGRKRKAHDEEQPYVDRSHKAKGKTEKPSRETKDKDNAKATKNSQEAPTLAAPPVPPTPSLKIRLPPRPTGSPLTPSRGS